MDLPDSNPKTRFGVAKPGIADIPPVAILTLGQGMTNGKVKYGRTNWREHEVTASVYYDAAARHMMSWWDGEENASDSGVHHLGHAMACFAILIDAASSGKLIDDRPGVKGTTSDFIARMTKPAESEVSAFRAMSPKAFHAAVEGLDVRYDWTEEEPVAPAEDCRYRDVWDSKQRGDVSAEAMQWHLRDRFDSPEGRAAIEAAAAHLGKFDLSQYTQHELIALAFYLDCHKAGLPFDPDGMDTFLGSVGIESPSLPF